MPTDKSGDFWEGPGFEADEEGGGKYAESVIADVPPFDGDVKDDVLAVFEGAAESDHEERGSEALTGVSCDEGEQVGGGSEGNQVVESVYGMRADRVLGVVRQKRSSGEDEHPHGSNAN